MKYAALVSLITLTIWSAARTDIEYDNVQDDANHIHTVWRDLRGAFGIDPLADHYATSPHHRHPVTE